jgi:uracil phosphoribosyltransferase
VGQVHISEHPLVKHKVTLLSDARTDAKTFRELVRELTRLLLYEATANLPLQEISYRTPMEETTGHRIGARIGLVPIIRAGLGMVEAAVDALPHAEVWHLGMYRDESTHRPVSYYNKLPDQCPDDVVLVLDPMLATGGSATDAITVLKEWGAKAITFVGIIGAPEGIELLTTSHPDLPVYLARGDRQLNEDRFILPGLGDAGDRLFGTVAPERHR